MDLALQAVAVRDIVERWVVWRDAGEWERLRSLWHPGGRMTTTWFDGTGDEFVDRSCAAFDRGLRVWHELGGSAVDIEGERAVAQTKVTISQRAVVEGVECDISCTARFHDLLERKDGRWAIVVRRGIYERDRLDPLRGSAPQLDEELLGRFPEGYRHLAYVQVRAGLDPSTNCAGLTGPEVEALYAEGRAWLGGALPDYDEEAR
ncbi:MAG TPA: nuclear transport factor 2 family protein [Acidimicrobiales bacterium]|nr:nuclear transport factor 2 family protein [Acidimicrobiales bacterium]